MEVGIASDKEVNDSETSLTDILFEKSKQSLRL